MRILLTLTDLPSWLEAFANFCYNINMYCWGGGGGGVFCLGGCLGFEPRVAVLRRLNVFAT
jgi:hypothetical protein